MQAHVLQPGISMNFVPARWCLHIRAGSAELPCVLVG